MTHQAAIHQPAGFSTVPILERRDLKRFEAQTMPYLPALYRTALRMLFDPATTAAAVEHTYQAARGRWQKAPPENPRVWLFVILFELLRQHRAGTAARTEGVLAALDALPAPLREVLVLVDVEGFTYRETAEILGVPAPVVPQRLSTARASLSC